MTLRDYAAPLRRLAVDKITTHDVLSVLKPLWLGLTSLRCGLAMCFGPRG
jgi:hypothetical protein